jgi:outer membrane protein OmpA-like peptidoglycan-associated protein
VLEPSLAARAPGVVWGMPDMAPAPAGLPAAAPSTQVAHAVTASRAVPIPAPLEPAVAPAEMVLAGEAAKPAPPAQVPRQAAPPAPAPVKPARPVPAETVLAGRAPDSVLAIPAAMADTPPSQIVAAVRPAPAITVAHAPLPAPAKPPVDSHAPEIEPVSLAGAAQPQPVAKPVADAAGIEVEGGLVAVDAASGRRRAAALGSVPFDPQSAMLTPDAVARLTQFLADAKSRDARIEIVGEAPAPALALDRALAVGLALVHSGVPANRLELTLARGGSGDQARLFLAVPAL